MDFSATFIVSLGFGHDYAPTKNAFREKNKSSTLNKKALNKKGFVYLYGSHLCAIFASIIILWISIGHTRNAFRGISHLKPLTLL